MHFPLSTTSAKSAADVTKLYLWTGALGLLELGSTHRHVVRGQAVPVPIELVLAPPVAQPIQEVQKPTETKIIYNIFHRTSINIVDPQLAPSTTKTPEHKHKVAHRSKKNTRPGFLDIQAILAAQMATDSRRAPLSRPKTTALGLCLSSQSSSCSPSCRTRADSSLLVLIRSCI